MNVSDKTTGGAAYTATEFNQFKNESQNAIVASGQALSASDIEQLGKAMFANGASASAMQDGGTANSIILSPVSGGSGLIVPDSYASLNGVIFTFNKSSVNTSTSVIVNAGQTGTELGAKSLKLPNGGDPAVGTVIGDCIVKYDGTNFVLLSYDGGTGIVDVSDTDTKTADLPHTLYVTDCTSADASWTLNAPAYPGQKARIEKDGTNEGEVAVNGSDLIIPQNNGISLEAVLINSVLSWSILANETGIKEGISANTSYTINKESKEEHLLFDSFSADVTLALTKGTGASISNRLKVTNDDPTYKLIVTGGTNTYWVMPGQTVSFIFKGTSLVWASAGWETRWTGLELSTISEAGFTDVANRPLAQFDLLAGIGNQNADGVSGSGLYCQISNLIGTSCRSYVNGYSGSGYFGWNNSTKTFSIGSAWPAMTEFRQFHDAI